MRILHLTLTSQWFAMIAAGEKPEEYRAPKPYWASRLVGREFDIVRFRNGYSPRSPTMELEWRGLDFGLGRPEWGAGDSPLFIIRLGQILQAPYCQY